MTAGGRDLQRAPREQLPADVGEIAIASLGRSRDDRRGSRGSARLVGSVERIDGFRQRSRDAHVEAFHDACLGGVLRREEQALQSETTGSDRDRQDAADAVDGAVERQLADDHRVVDGSSRERS